MYNVYIYIYIPKSIEACRLQDGHHVQYTTIYYTTILLSTILLYYYLLYYYTKKPALKRADSKMGTMFSFPLYIIIRYCIMHMVIFA